MAQNMHLSKNMDMPRNSDATERSELERRQGAIRTALFLLALSLAVQVVVPYLWF
ncbi:MAG: hypothetical protein NTAFB09_22410 [Nitrosospira sp.]